MNIKLICIVLFIGYHFNDRLRMYSELEQAYVEYDLLDKPKYGITQSSIRGGLFLIHGQPVTNLVFAKTQVFLRGKDGTTQDTGETIYILSLGLYFQELRIQSSPESLAQGFV